MFHSLGRKTTTKSTRDTVCLNLSNSFNSHRKLSPQILKFILAFIDHANLFRPFREIRRRSLNSFEFSRRCLLNSQPVRLGLKKKMAAGARVNQLLDLKLLLIKRQYGTQGNQDYIDRFDGKGFYFYTDIRSYRVINRA